MLEPQSRQLLLDSLHPPEGHRLDWTVGTTYSLDLLAILSAPVAFAFADWHDRDGRPTMDPLALLKAVRQYADRICLFCQAGKIHVPRSYQPLMTHLEESIVGVVPPPGGSFHAKLWFLRYIGEDDAVTYRLLCLSRNMTFDRSWDTILSLEGELRDRMPPIKRNHPLGEFVETLPRMAVPELSQVWQQRLEQLGHEILRVEFEVPVPFEDMAFWTFGTGESEVWPFPDSMKKILVVAPFVDDQFAADLAWHEAPMQLVSRPESLAMLQPETLNRFEKVWILNDTAEAEPAEIEQTGAMDTGEPGAKGNKPEVETVELPLIGLHAKVYIADCGWDAHVWTGSANATSAGFGRNVEVLVQLTGKRSNCGVDAVLGQPEGNSEKKTPCLADLLRPYKAHETADAKRQVEREFERQAQMLACALASARPGAHCLASAVPDSFTILIRPTRQTNVLVPQGWELRAWPISMQETFAQSLDPTEPTWVQFEKVSFEGITSFFAFEIRLPSLGLQQRFVLNLLLIGAPENRREHVLRMMLSDPERVFRFLLLLLMDNDARDFGTWFLPASSGHEPRFAIHSMFQSTLFESLVRALDREPGRIDQVAQVVQDLGQTPEGKKLLPKDFEEVWAPIWEVRQQQLAQQQRDN